MASPGPLKDIDEKFLRCCICKKQLKEPKFLPCLHRNCLECLKRVSKKGAKKIQCVTCREEHTLPKDGIDSLKTDFNTENIIEFIQLQDSVKVDPLRTCIHCKKKQEASAFCFRCNDFLCETCHKFHASSSIVKDHHPHIFSLSEAGAANLTIQKLSSLKVAPRCQTHPEKLSELCCTTCGNLPVCIPCTYGEHRGHSLKEVKSLAKIQREMLEGKLADLGQYREKVYSMRGEIKKTKDKLELDVDQEIQKLQEQLDGKRETIKKEIQDAEMMLETKQANLEERMKQKASARKEEFEKEVKKLTEKYERACREEKHEFDLNDRKLQEKNDKEREKLEGGLRVMNNKIQELLVSLKRRKEVNARKTSDHVNHFDGIVKRFETVSTTADCILAAQNDWADVQCILDVSRAIDLLREEVKRNSPGMRNLFGVTTRGLTPGVTTRKKLGISENVETITDFMSISRGKNVSDITGYRDGTIAITGLDLNGQTYIAVITMKRGLQQQYLFTSFWTGPRCSFLSQFLIAFIVGHEVGIYDIRDQSKRSTRLSDVIMNYPTDRRVVSVTTDPVNGHIIVGCNNRDVYMLNNKLEHFKTLKLPAAIQHASYLAMYNGDMFVCDSSLTGGAFAVTLKQTSSEVKYKFTKPIVGGLDWSPHSVCTGQNGYIYILWRANSVLSIIVQYNKNGGQIEMAREVDRTHYVTAMTAVQAELGEKLLLSTKTTRRLLTYGLI